MDFLNVDMSSVENDQHDEPQHSKEECPHNKRSMANLQKLLQTPQHTRNIKFSEEGVPTRPSRANFQAHLSYVPRSHLSCTGDKWKQVDPKLKDTMWNDVKV
jgi:hypothetical protein